MDFPVHHSTESTPRDRGRGLGVAQSERIAAVVEIYERLFQHTAQIGPDEMRRLGGSAMEVIQGWAPDLGEEIEGIAAGSGHDVAVIAAMNARTEILAAGRGECSTVACLGNARRTASRSASRRGTGTTTSPGAGWCGGSTTPTGGGSRR